MRVAIVGSRSIDDEQYVFDEISTILAQRTPPDEPIVIISGGAKGVDSIAKMYAEDNGYDFILFKPYHLIDNKADFQPRYFFSRNRQIVDNSDLVVCLWDGESNGTEHVIQYATRKGKALEIVIRKYDSEQVAIG